MSARRLGDDTRRNILVNTSNLIRQTYQHLIYGAGGQKRKKILESINLSTGNTVSITEIWTINPMPNNRFSQDELDSINMAEAEENLGPNGETLREIISDTYHCESKEKENYDLRRFITS